jgi:hypothetical protein
MLGHIQAAPPPSTPPPPPPLADIPGEEDDLYFKDGDKKNPALAALNAEFRTGEKREAAEEAMVVAEEAAVVVVEAMDDDDLAFLDELPDPEKAMEQRALLASFESAKKVDDVSYARAQAEEEQLCSVLDLSVQ